MKAGIRDREALLAVSPAALSAYARAAGWTKVEPYGDHSDVYNGGGLPEIILPRTQRLGDYAGVVAQLVDIFARAAEMDELSLYRDLVTADCDVIRVRAAEGGDGTVAVDAGIDLMRGAHDMILAAACSLGKQQPVYRPGANEAAADYVRRMRLGQTEQGSFVVTLLSSVVPPPIQLSIEPGWSLDDLVERQMTGRLVDALRAARQATEEVVGGGADPFDGAVQHGVSANLCEALVKLIEPFPTLDVSITWARTRPMPTPRDIVCFAKTDAPILAEAARSFRDRAPRPDMRLYGFVRSLKRDESETDGEITLRASIGDEDPTKSVTAVLNQSDYEQAIQAHKEKAAVIAEGDLERVGRRWKLLNPRIVKVISAGDAPDESE